MQATFGTDGIRGVANQELTPELALAVGRAVARVVLSERFAIGRDSRRSGAMLQAALSAGLVSEGADVLDLGVLPTPGVAWYCERNGIPGAVISASHNPFQDNGIKVFGAGGLKLDNVVERSIEAELERRLDAAREGPRPAAGHSVGRILDDLAVEEGYLDHLLGSLEGRSLGGLPVVVDGANGAAWRVLPDVLSRAGADVTATGCEPDGVNINEGCGSLHPDNAAREVAARGASLGLAVDGDGDRLVAVSESGAVVDGDGLIALFARDLQARGRLAGKTVAVTVMSNLGLLRVLEEMGVAVRQTAVGDRYVLEEMARHGLSLGGEQSGHVIFRDQATTGDGILTGLLLADLMVREGRSLDDMVRGLVDKVPQVLVNVPAGDPKAVVDSPSVREAAAAIEAKLGASGRVLLRASGTEPLVRVMVECDDEETATASVDELVAAVVDAAVVVGAASAASPVSAPGSESPS